VEFPSHLLDELARVFAQAALDRLLRDAMAANHELAEKADSQSSEHASSATSKTPPCES
jgi:hypothetical protein